MKYLRRVFKRQLNFGKMASEEGNLKCEWKDKVFADIQRIYDDEVIRMVVYVFKAGGFIHMIHW